MSEGAPKSAAWAEANRLLGALAASVGNGVEARLGGAADADDWSERAAIMEFDGGLPRAAAERLAREFSALGPAPSPSALAVLDAQLLAMDMRRLDRNPAKAIAAIDVRLRSRK
jgi:hypothetical protein